MKRKIIVGILLLIVVGGIVGVRLYTKKVTNYADEKPDFTVSVQELLAAFENDTASAGRQYIDKIVRVSGAVKRFDSTAVVLGAEGNPSDVVVGLDDRNRKGALQFKIGEQATLQGKFSGYTKSSDPDDMISSLGATINIDYAGVISKK